MEPIKIDKVSDVTTASVPSGGACLAVGYSARSLAEALCKAGFSVIACDAFGDQDTTEYAKVPQIITNWGARGAENPLRPDQWAEQLGNVNRHPEDARLPVFLSGGCENWPELVAAIANTPHWDLLGAAPAELAELREPNNWQAAAACKAAGTEDAAEVLFPPTIWSGEPPEDLASCHTRTAEGCSQWLIKRKNSAGGLGVSWLGSTKSERPNSLASSETYVQTRIAGRVLGVALVVNQRDQARPVKIVGVTESWSCRDWPGPAEFIYRGSFGPVYLSVQQQAAIEQLAQRLVQTCAPLLVGWLQVDLIEQPSGQLWLLEVNPRWTAGMEVLLQSGLANMAAVHAQACGWPVTKQPVIQSPQCWVGKSIFYANGDVELSRELLGELFRIDRRHFADIPAASTAGSVISIGHPILTIRAALPRESYSEAEARSKLLRMLGCLRDKVQRLIDRHAH